MHKGYFAHTAPDGTTPWDLMKAHFYKINVYLEYPVSRCLLLLDDTNE